MSRSKRRFFATLVVVVALAAVRRLDVETNEFNVVTPNSRPSIQRLRTMSRSGTRGSQRMAHAIELGIPRDNRNSLEHFSSGAITEPREYWVPESLLGGQVPWPIRISLKR